jgi:plasmid stability protein
MATVTIHDLDENLEVRLRQRADLYGRSMEDEARKILQSALGAGEPENENMAEAIHSCFAPYGGVDLAPIKREPMPDPIDFGE